MNNFKPYGNRILVERLPDEHTTASGKIVLPDTAKKKNKLARVIAIGDKHETVKVGDYVLLLPYMGVEIEDNYICLKEEDILAYTLKEDMEECQSCD